MSVVRSLLRFGMLFLVLIIVGTVLILYYPWIFSKRVDGEIIEVERITQPTAIFGKSTPESMIHSYAILIQDKEGVMYTSSSEDRQWQIAKKGYCAIALFYRYPFWDLDKAGTFFNARLNKVYKCPGKAEPIEDVVPEAGADPTPAPEADL